MREERQKYQRELASSDGGGGEAVRAVDRGNEARTANRVTQSPASTTAETMEEICEAENLRQALRRVRENKGGAGVDGMTVEELPDYLRAHWPRIKKDLLAGKYRPQPVKRVAIPKPDGGTRTLGIPTVLDRFIQQAALQVLQKRWDPTFSEYSYGFRPGRSTHMAVAQAQRYIAEGKSTVVDIDLEKFFDEVNHDVLMNRISRREKDKRLLKLIGAMLRAGMMEDGVSSGREKGTPQGGPLSPLLSNLMLDELDKELEKRGLSFVRYADDCNIYVSSQRAGERVMTSIKKFIGSKLKLKVNEAKSAVAKPSKRSFLGFSFTIARDASVKRRLAPRTIERFKTRVRKQTGRRAQTSEQYMKPLRQYLLGWLSYFRHCQTPSALAHLESWTRHRVRNLIWRQWQKPSRRVAALKRLGIPDTIAKGYGNSSRGSWYMSSTRVIERALSNVHLESLGLPRFLPLHA